MQFDPLASPETAPRLRCVTLQRDDQSIDRWCRYHGYLFGFENLTVIDNGSTDPEVVATLRRYRRAGSTIVWQHHRPDTAEAHAEHVERVLRHSEEHHAADALLALASDEFAVLFDDNGLSFSRQVMSRFLSTLGAEKRTIELGVTLTAATDEQGYYAAELSSKSLHVLGGNATAEAARATELTCLGLRSRPADGTLLVGFPQFSALLRALDADTGPIGGLPADGSRELPILLPAERRRRRQRSTFDGQRYLSLNADVANAGWPPLKHFIMHGHREKRDIGP